MSTRLIKFLVLTERRSGGEQHTHSAVQQSQHDALLCTFVCRYRMLVICILASTNRHHRALQSQPCSAQRLSCCQQQAPVQPQQQCWQPPALPSLPPLQVSRKGPKPRPQQRPARGAAASQGRRPRACKAASTQQASNLSAGWPAHTAGYFWQGRLYPHCDGPVGLSWAAACGDAEALAGVALHLRR